MNKHIKFYFLLFIIGFLTSCQNNLSRPVIKEMNSQSTDSTLLINGVLLSRDIINGESVYNISEIPWQVGLLEPKENIDCFCGGSLINEKFILTAAHCLYYEENGELKRRTNSEIYVFANSSNLSQGGEIYDVKRIIEHPNYNKENNDNDIALLELTSPINTYYSNQIINLPSKSDYEELNKPDKSVIVSGWGATSVYGDVYPEILKKGNVSIKSHSICLDNYIAENKVVTKNMICASGDNIDSCSGDSGGPLFTFIDGNAIQLGITSWGSFPCADNKLFGVYTNIFNYLDWINTNCSKCLDNNSIL